VTAIRNPYREALVTLSAAIADSAVDPTVTVGPKTYGAADLQLLSVEAAIFAVEQGAQAFGVAGRSFTKADLPTLYKRRDELERRADRATAGGVRLQAVVPL
jgi:hypothetical protein